MAKPQGRKQQQVQEERDDGMREKMVSINRVTKVVKGGRILGFAALTVVGDGDGGIGMGKGKSREVPVAVQKAMEEARRKMAKISLKNGTLHHTVTGKHGATTVLMSPPLPVPGLSLVVRCVQYLKSWGLPTWLPRLSVRPIHTTWCAQPCMACWP